MTAKVLQKPKIIGIVGSTVMVAHPDVSENLKVWLHAPVSAAGVTLTLSDNFGFQDDDNFIVGSVGDQKTEEGQVDESDPIARGTSLTIDNTLKFGHELNDPVVKINERAIKIYGAATDGGAGTLIASIDAITTPAYPLAKAWMIQWHQPFTSYTLKSTDTAYNFYYATFYDGVTESTASDYISASGTNSSSAAYIIESALDLTATKVDEENITWKRLIKWADEAQSEITGYMYQDSQTLMLRPVDWDFEVAEDTTSLAVTTDENEYDLSSLSPQPKHVNQLKSIISVRIGDSAPIEKQTKEFVNKLLTDKPKTYTSGQHLAGATTLNVVNNSQFPTSGTLFIAGQEITYTGKSGTTQFTGIPGAGTGSITATINDGASAWKDSFAALPANYTVFNGKLIFSAPVSSEYSGYPIKIEYFKKLPALTEISDTTEISFPHLLKQYVASMIERRRRNFDVAENYMGNFEKKLLKRAAHNQVPQTDEIEYYKYTTDYL